MSEKNKDIIKKLILAAITLFGLFTVIASGGGSSSSSVSKDNQTETPQPSEGTPPTVSIISPADESVYDSGSFITFIGTAYDSNGKTLSGSNLVWTSSKDKQLGIGTILEPQYLSDGTHEITLRATDSSQNVSMAKIKISLQEEQNTPPVVSIIRPGDDTTFSSGQMILFEGTSQDAEDGYLTGDSLKWFSTIDNEIGTGNTITKTDLSGGKHIITLIAKDSNGLDATASPITINILNTRPAAQITYPPDGSTYDHGDTITFNGEGTDTEDGDLFGASLEWRSNIYGDFGQGRDLAISFLPAGTHLITLTVTDKNGSVDTDDITITIN